MKVKEGWEAVHWRVREIREDSGRLEVGESQGGGGRLEVGESQGSGGGNQGWLGNECGRSRGHGSRAMPVHVQGTVRRYYASFPSA